MATLKQRVTDLKDANVLKLNLLHSISEKIDNKKTNLASTDANHFPNVPAVNAGLATTLAASKTYTDSKITGLPAYIPLAQKGAANGVVPLNSNKLIDAQYLPSYVDDVVDLVAFVATNPTSGMVAGEKRYNTATKKIFTSTNATTGVISDPEGDKIYVLTSNSTTHRWSGSAMSPLNAGIVLGSTSTTAHRGDHGAVAHTHSLKTSGNPHNVTKADVGLSNVTNTSDAQKPVSTAQATAIAVVQSDLNNYRTTEIGTGFPDYAAQFLAEINF